MLKVLDGSAGYGKPLTEQEIKDFLTTQILNIYLGTIDEKGQANIHPAWYYYDSSKERIYIETRKHSKKIENVSRNNTIYFCVDSHSPPHKGVRGKGHGKIFYDVNFNISVAQKIHMRYLGDLEHQTAQKLIDSIMNGRSVILEISPKYYSTWNTEF